MSLLLICLIISIWIIYQAKDSILEHGFLVILLLVDAVVGVNARLERWKLVHRHLLGLSRLILFHLSRILLLLQLVIVFIMC